MRRFLTLTALLCVLFSVMLAGCVLYGRRQPMPDMLGQYNVERCGTSWCFRGITLGRSSWADALTSLGYPQNTVAEKVAVNLTEDASVNASLYFAPDKFPVRQMLITFSDKRTAPTIGQVIAQFGSPCVINMSYARTYISIVLRYPSMAFVGQIDNAHTLQDDNVSLRSQSSLSAMWLSDSRQNDCSPETLIQSDDLIVFSVPWRGFESLNIYRAHYIVKQVTENSN